jgi:ABC-type nitrate/sulfonate/bicarbonate transport system substrate-binding protein
MDLATLGVEYPLIALGTLRPTIQERPGVLRGFLAAYVDATAWIASHRTETLDVLARYTRQEDPEVLALTYDFYVPHSFPRAPYPTLGGIRTILDAIRDSDPRAADARPADFVDDRFVRELDESGYIERLYR